jgi:cell division protein FtsQ
VARKSSSTAVQEELYPLTDESAEREALDDARLVDLEADEESPFLRGQKRIPVRRGTIPKKTAHRLMWVVVALAACAIVAIAGAAIYRYGERSWRFRIDSSDQIEITGAQHVTHGAIMEVMGGDIGRNIFFIPLAQRKVQLEQIPWVESASVMRFVPNRLRVEIHERTPVAFARVGSHVSLIDPGGTLMELTPSAKRKYSFPVITGMNSGEPLSTRAARMKNYNELVRQLDAGGARNSQALSEVDLTDTEDTKVVVSDPNGEVLVHLGSGNYLQRYQTYVANVQKWREKYQKLESVDLRFDGQIIVNPDLQGMPHQPTLTQAAAKAAMAAGVKQAALVNYEKYVTHPPAQASPKPAKTAKVAAKPQAKPTAKHVVKRAAQKQKAKAKAKPPAKTVPVAKKAAPVPTVATAAPAPAKPAKVEVARTPALHSKPTTVQPPPTTAAQKKPSAGIPKESSPN